jgi:quercetin dioxygenase-like cupin family protein
MSDPKPIDDSEKADALHPSWAGLFAQHLTVSDDNALSAQAAAAIKQKVMQRIGTTAGSNVSTAKGSIKNSMRDSDWKVLTKSLHVKLLHDDGKTISWLLKLLPGGYLPVHDHADGVEECMVIEGELKINGEPFKAGDYQVAYPGSVHHQVASETGAVLFLKSPVSRKKDLMFA